MDFRTILNILLFHILLEQIFCAALFINGGIHSFTRAVVRKKRFVVFSNYASMKITAITGKHIIARYPRRMNLSLEVSLYYALPTKLEEWYPQRYRSTTPKPHPMMKNLQKAKNRVFDMHSNQISPRRRVWDSMPCSNEACFPQSFTRYHHHPEYVANYAYVHNISMSNNKDSENYSPMSIDHHHHNNYGQVHKILRAHRDRRSFYRHLENTGTSYGVKFRACVLRMICEVKNYLLPRGYSLFQDILRIFFTFPTLDYLKDEYTKALRHEDPNCNQLYGQKCPISILEFMLNPKSFK